LHADTAVCRYCSVPGIIFFFFLDTEKYHRKEVSKKESWPQHTWWQEEKGPGCWWGIHSCRAWGPR
jgi:hypothetical protein